MSAVFNTSILLDHPASRRGQVLSPGRCGAFRSPRAGHDPWREKAEFVSDLLTAWEYTLVPWGKEYSTSYSAGVNNKLSRGSTSSLSWTDSEQRDNYARASLTEGGALTTQCKLVTLGLKTSGGAGKAGLENLT